jgi:transposase
MNKTTKKARNSKKVNLIKLSADAHKRQYKICRQVGDQNIQPPQTFAAEEVVGWALGQLALAERVVFCYEAGPFGYELARRLQQGGVEPLVMCPQLLDERCRRVATDKRDARQIAGRLDRYLAGNQEALAVVRIPTVAEEDERAQSRLREQMRTARHRFESQGRSYLLYKGLSCPEGWWRGSESRWEQRIQGQGWSETVVQQLLPYRRLALAADAEVQQLTVAMEQAARSHLPAGLTELPAGFGELSMEVIRREVCAWDRFKNRRQVGSFMGLCPGEASTGETRWQGPITKAGNPLCRYYLIQLAWRASAFQPDYWVVKKFGPRLAQTKARSVARKKLIVAMARLIAVDLWRLYTGQTTLANLGLKPRTGRTYVLQGLGAAAPAGAPDPAGLAGDQGVGGGTAGE